MWDGPHGPLSEVTELLTERGCGKSVGWSSAGTKLRVETAPECFVLPLKIHKCHKCPNSLTFSVSIPFVGWLFFPPLSPLKWWNIFHNWTLVLPMCLTLTNGMLTSAMETKAWKLFKQFGLALLYFNHLHGRTKTRQTLKFLEEDRKHTEQNQSPHPWGDPSKNSRATQQNPA